MIVQLKQVSFNPGQEDGQWPRPFLGFPENGTEFGQPGAHKGRTHKAKVYTPPLIHGAGQAYVLTYFLPVSVCLHVIKGPVQLGPANLFTEVKACDLLLYMNNSPQHSRKLSILEPVGLPC